MRMQGGSRWRSSTHVVGGIGRVLKPVVGAQAGQGAAQQEGAAEVGRRTFGCWFFGRRPQAPFSHRGPCNLPHFSIRCCDSMLTMLMLMSGMKNVDNVVDKTYGYIFDIVHIIDIVDVVNDAVDDGVVDVVVLRMQPPVSLAGNFCHASGKRLQSDSPSFDPPAVPSGGDSLKIQVGRLSSWIAVIDTQGNSRNPGSCLSTMAPWSCYQIGKFVHVYATTLGYTQMSSELRSSQRPGRRSKEEGHSMGL